MAIKIEGAKKVKKAARDPIFMDEKYTGVEPIWDTDRALTFTEEEFDHYFRQSMRYYNYFYSVKDLKKYFVEWLRKHQGNDGHHTLDKATVDYYAKTKDALTPFTACAIIKAHTKGMPLRDRHVEYLLATVKKVIDLAEAAGEEVVEAKSIAPAAVIKQPTIQDRLNEKMSEILGEFEGHFDDVVANKKTAFKTYDFLVANNVPQAQLGKFEKNIKTKQAEVVEAQDKKDEQLTEGYAHWKTLDFKRVTAWFTDALAAIEQYRGVKRATKKAAVRKPPQKEKLVAKLKYLKTDPTLKLVSVNPVDIVGAQALWVYNVKTRKIGCYYAEDLGGVLGVKGTTIIGFDEAKSTQKTLRKPDQQLKEFLTAGKVELRKFLGNIKATEIKLTGRINQDTVLLKVQ